MSSRTILSRPRTRIYDANYNIGENYYRSALDRLDQKYSPRAFASAGPSTVANDIRRRHEEAFLDEDLATSRRRAEQRISEGNLFDFRGRRLEQRAVSDLFNNDIDQETASALKHIRSKKRISTVDDVDLESTVNNISSHRLLDRSDKILKSVGLDEGARRALDEDVSVKRRSLRVTYEAEGGPELTKWSSLQRSDDLESAATARAKKSRDRIRDIEDEMAAMAEKQDARERRAARLRALVAESAEETEAAQSAVKAISYKSRREQRTFEE